MNNNSYYDFDRFMFRLNEYRMQVEKMDQTIERNKKILKAIKDTIDFMNSFNSLNIEEKDMYFKALLGALMYSESNEKI